MFTRPTSTSEKRHGDPNVFDRARCEERYSPRRCQFWRRRANVGLISAIALCTASEICRSLACDCRGDGEADLLTTVGAEKSRRAFVGAFFDAARDIAETNDIWLIVCRSGRVG